MAEEQATHQEIADLKLQITALSVKLDAISASLNTTNIALARQDGANFPQKIANLEQSVKALETVRDNRSWMPDALMQVQTDVKNLEFFKYKVVGVLILVQVVATVAGKFILDAIWKSPVAPAVSSVLQ